MINNYDNYQIKYNTDLKVYTTINILFNSLSIGVIVISFNNEDLKSMEIEREILSITFVLLFICELEYMGLL